MLRRKPTFTADDYYRLESLKGSVIVKPTLKTLIVGKTIELSIVTKGSSYTKVILALQGDTELRILLNGDITLAILVTVTYGFVTEFAGDLVMKKVRKALGIVLQ